MAAPIVLGGKRIGRIRASYLLTCEAFRFFRADTEMFWVPVIGIFVQLFLLAVLCIGVLLPLGVFGAVAGEVQMSNYHVYGIMFAIYLMCAFVTAFSQGVITHIVYVRAHGGDATLGDGFRTSANHVGALFVWACITSTIGIILRIIVERSEILMKIVAFIFGTAWSVLTYFVVPAIIIDKKTAIASIPHSGNTFKRTWGETVIVNIGIGLVFFLAIVALVLAGALIVSGGHAGIALGSGVVFCGALVVLIIMSSVLDSVLKTLLYIYANENVVPSNFNSELLAQILGRKGSGVPVPNMVPPVV